MYIPIIGGLFQSAQGEGNGLKYLASLIQAPGVTVERFTNLDHSKHNKVRPKILEYLLRGEDVFGVGFSLGGGCIVDLSHSMQDRPDLLGRFRMFCVDPVPIYLDARWRAEVHVIPDNIPAAVAVVSSEGPYLYAQYKKFWGQSAMTKVANFKIRGNHTGVMEHLDTLSIALDFCYNVTDVFSPRYRPTQKM